MTNKIAIATKPETQEQASTTEQAPTGEQAGDTQESITVVTSQEMSNETVSISDTAVIQPPIDADKEQAFPNTSDTRTVADVDKEIKQANADLLANQIPSNWVITPGEGDDIVAVNNITKKTFTGSVADFNSILRG